MSYPKYDPETNAYRDAGIIDGVTIHPSASEDMVFDDGYAVFRLQGSTIEGIQAILIDEGYSINGALRQMELRKKETMTGFTYVVVDLTRGKILGIDSIDLIASFPPPSLRHIPIIVPTGRSDEGEQLYELQYKENPIIATTQGINPDDDLINLNLVTPANT